MQIVWLRVALKNLDEITAYIAEENPAVANLVVETIEAHLNQLRLQPGIGEAGRVVGTRELAVGGTHYRVPYRIKNNAVEILRVFHTSRKPAENL